MNKGFTSLLAALIAAISFAGEKTLQTIEVEFRSNEYQASKTNYGRLFSVDLFVGTVENSQGKPVIHANIEYYVEPRMTLNAVIKLSKANESQALKLLRGDQLRVTGTLKKRTTSSRTQVTETRDVRTNDLLGTDSETYVTTTYFFEGSSLKVVKTKKQRQAEEIREKEQAEAKAAAEQKKLSDFNKALNALDFIAADKILETGIPQSHLDKWIDEIAKLSEDSPGYVRAVRIFEYIIGTDKMDGQKAVALTIGEESLSSQRPELFKVLIALHRINSDGKWDNGENMLLYLLKDQFQSNLTKQVQNHLNPMLKERNYKMIKVLLESGQANKLVDMKDSFGKSAYEYVMEDTRSRMPGLKVTLEHFYLIKELIIKAHEANKG